MTTQINPDAPYALVEPDHSQLSILDIAESDIIQLYKQHGAILLRGFSFDVSEFKAFTDKFCQSTVFNESPGRKTIDSDANIQTVNLGDEAFPLHPEISREPWKPDVCFFACETPPITGGETTICDGIELVKRLPENVATTLRDNRLDYINLATENECLYWLGMAKPDDATLNSIPENCPYTFSRYGDQILRIYNAPTLHKPMFSNELAFGNFLLFSYQLNATRFPMFTKNREVPRRLVKIVKETAEQITTAVKWQKHDVLMLDNTRFLHGRNTINDASSRLILSFFGYLKFAVPSVEETPHPPWRTEAFVPPR
ncbi:MAG: alpha-ketoglutarate-dependent taurine dioxygenase [Halioglobus sp.]|jgi:alpha-ketoglutarate-dependent taurine dioxygenase